MVHDLGQVPSLRKLCVDLEAPIRGVDKDLDGYRPPELPNLAYLEVISRGEMGSDNWFFTCFLQCRLPSLFTLRLDMDSKNVAKKDLDELVAFVERHPCVVQIEVVMRHAADAKFVTSGLSITHLTTTNCNSFRHALAPTIKEIKMSYVGQDELPFLLDVIVSASLPSLSTIYILSVNDGEFDFNFDPFLDHFNMFTWNDLFEDESEILHETGMISVLGSLASASVRLRRTYNRRISLLDACEKDFSGNFVKVSTGLLFPAIHTQHATFFVSRLSKAKRFNINCWIMSSLATAAAHGNLADGATLHTLCTDSCHFDQISVLVNTSYSFLFQNIIVSRPCNRS
jgi:hypothetical protein